MRSEPRVDAGDVESVAALRKQADLVAVGVLRQADRALAELGVGGGGVVSEPRKRLEDLLLEAFVGGGGGGGGGAVTEPGASGHGDEADDAD